MPIYHRPHSQKWFAVLAAFDQIQAAHTRAIVERAGREDVCGICGDDPANDYEIVAPGPHKDAVATIRLCDDCRQIREMGGESYRPFDG